MIRAKDLTYRYIQSEHGIPPISLEISPGEIVHLHGESGSGKSTLARCLTGLIPHLYRGELGGDVWINGKRTINAELWQLAEQVGLVFQNPAAQMLALTVEEEIIFGLENLGLPVAEITRRVEETLTRFDLHPFRDRAPHTLSGGEQQKVALAAMMARRPPVLVLDEPLSMLDTTAATELIERLIRLAAEGTTIIICEHRAEYLHPIPNLRTVTLPGRNTPEPLPPIHPTNGKTPPALTLHASKLGVAIGQKTIFAGLDFSARGGEITAVVGRNGAGKTTLLRALAGLQKFSGKVSINGETPDLGLVFQNADLQLFNATVRDEILYRLPNPDLARYRRLLEVLGLNRYEETPPLLLSEGEKKRVALATVLMRRPQHGVLLDEPSLGQDARHKTHLLHLARLLANEGQLVVLTTHDLPLAAQADRLLLLGSTGIVADGSPETVFADTQAWKSIGLTVPNWAHPAPKMAVCRD